MKLRLFVGIPAPDEWRSALRPWRAHIQPRFSDFFGKWTPEINLHLTLRFFGAVEETEVTPLVEKLRAIANGIPEFSVTAGELGCFPNLSRPRILWLGLGGGLAPLTQLESKLRSATAEYGQPPDNRPFHPHLTLARLSEPTRQDRNQIAELAQEPPLSEAPLWKINALELICSELKPEGSIYHSLAILPLANPQFLSP
jgi:2'-5' RNA ligase